jgi:hypothetical protein
MNASSSPIKGRGEDRTSDALSADGISFILGGSKIIEKTVGAFLV